MEFRSFIAAACILVSGASSSGAGETCNLAPIERPLTNSRLGSYSYPVRSIAIEFLKRDFEIPSEGTLRRKAVAVPQLRMSLDVTSHPATVVQKVKSLEGQIPGVDSTVHHSQTSVSQQKLRVEGHLTIQKWVSMDGFECKWKSEWWGGYPECSRTVWKTKIFDRDFPWYVDSGLRSSMVFPLDPKPIAPDPVSNRSVFDPVSDVTISSQGSADFSISNDLERFVSDALFWFVSVLTKGDFNNWNLKNEIPEFGIGNDTVPLDAREVLYPANKGLKYRDASDMVGREGYRGLWQIFVDTLNFDQGLSGYRTSGENLLLDLVYVQDNPAFARKLNENRDPNSKTPVMDPFYLPFFCASDEARSKVKDYLEELAKQLEGKDSDVPFTGDRSALKDVVGEKYGTTRSISLLTEHGYVNELSSGLFEGRLPGFDDLWDKKSVILPWDTVDSFTRFFDITGRERDCLTSQFRARNGSENVLKPFQVVKDCGAGLSAEQNAVVKEAIGRLESDPTLYATAFDGFVAPVSNPTYRGWYYCYQNPRICVGKNQIYWWQQPSKFNERGGNHKGIDVYGDDGQGATSLFAVTSGRAIFSNRDPNGWGNALLIPFEKDGASYFAVYAHLPATARSFDGKPLKKGDAIGVTGCSGNAGDGAGNCNTYCFWSGQARTDEHLHFEIIKHSTTGNEIIDPVAATGITVSSDSRQFRAKCDEKPKELANSP